MVDVERRESAAMQYTPFRLQLSLRLSVVHPLVSPAAQVRAGQLRRRNCRFPRPGKAAGDQARPQQSSPPLKKISIPGHAQGGCRQMDSQLFCWGCGPLWITSVNSARLNFLLAVQPVFHLQQEVLQTSAGSVAVCGCPTKQASIHRVPYQMIKINFAGSDKEKFHAAHARDATRQWKM